MYINEIEPMQKKNQIKLELTYMKMAKSTMKIEQIQYTTRLLCTYIPNFE